MIDVASLGPILKSKSTEFHNYSLVIRHLSFDSASSRKSKPSGLAVKAYGNILAFNDDRDFACALGVLQHGFKMLRCFYDVVVFELAVIPGKSFTSCAGIGSGIFSENNDAVGHFIPPLV